ncbi:MAG: toprim domain-containing protein [Alphaproteobacteria bacterium]
MSDWNRFKTEINLSEYAAYCGYEVDRKNSTKSSVKMKNGSDIIIVSKKGNSWVYFSVVDDTDNGAIVNFIQNRTGKELKDIARELLAWLGEDAPKVEAKDYVRDVEQQDYDPERIKRIFKGCHPMQYHTYLETRGIAKRIFNAPRFKNRLFFDRHKNAVFPHYNAQGDICGLELKNEEKAVFVRGSEKTFWRSHCQKGDDTLVISEAVIDALSYSMLFPSQTSVYAATGGGMSPEQGGLLKSAVQGFKSIKTIIIAVDNDEGGDRLAAKIEAVIIESGFTGETLRHSPKAQGQDWNNILQERR